MINNSGDIRTIVEKAITQEKLDKIEVNESKMPKILLIDEVDVFFNKDFYGNIYTPSTKL
jgi:hypothetical protein